MEIASTRVTCQASPPQSIPTMPGVAALLGDQLQTHLLDYSPNTTPTDHHPCQFPPPQSDLLIYHGTSSVDPSPPLEGVNQWLELGNFPSVEGSPTESLTAPAGCQYSRYHDNYQANNSFSPGTSQYSPSSVSSLGSPSSHETCLGYMANTQSGVCTDTSGVDMMLYPNTHPYSCDNGLSASPSVVSATTWMGDFLHPKSGDNTLCHELAGKSQKPKRKRVINKTQRKAANHRERKRMVTLNDAFSELKDKIPKFSNEKKISRIETLCVAISYIGFMSDIVNGKHPHIETKNIEKMLK